MNIVVTGGAGYIGSITTRYLCDKGHEVTVVDTLENGHREAIDERAKFYEGSVGDANLMSEVLDGQDAVMHLAGYIEVAESKQFPEKYFHNNVTAAEVMLDAMVEAGVSKLVFSSTAAVYGEPERIPIVETDPTVPINPYGQSKLDFERLLDAYAEKITSIRFRYFNVAGAWPDGYLGESHNPETHIIPRFIQTLLAGADELTIFGDDYPTADGTCIRDYIHVVDLAQAHCLGLEALGAGETGGVYNLGNGEGFSNKQVAEACCRAIGATPQIVFGDRRPGDPARLIASPQAAIERFSWQQQFPNVDTMVAHALLWHRNPRY